MNGRFDYKKFAILYVDDEEKSLKMFSQAFERSFRVYTAPSAAEGFRVLEQHHDDIGVLMSDQRMPGEKGAQFLERARKAHPCVIRILATAYADIEAAITAVNSGAIYRYVAKPWEVVELEQVLRRALEFFQVWQERDQLLREKLSVIHNMMIADRVVGLGIMAAGLNHHIRNSLVAVRTFLDLAPLKLEQEQVKMDQLRNPTYWRGFYEQVQAQVKRITDMLDGLGLATDRPPGRFEDLVHLPALISETLQRARQQLEEKQIQVDNRLPVDLPEIYADRAKICRLFDLLIQDEVVSLPKGRTIRMSGSVLPGDTEQSTLVQVEVQDDGLGLSPEALRSVFDPFFTRVDNPQELGINLMACYFIVYHHGGRIEVKSREGAGTTFLITLPVHPQGQTPITPEKEFLGKALLNDELWHRLLAGKEDEHRSTGQEQDRNNSLHGTMSQA
jgi:two-component system, probable response regulator PhcQ